MSTDTGSIWGARAIMLLDLDAFFASVEQLDHPQWRGKPVIVGGDADRRGVVSTCSYEAREFGVRSAMPASLAARLCPDAIWVFGNYPRYAEMSQQVMEIMLSYSPFLQQVSVDEAFLDITPSKYHEEDPVTVARSIQKSVAMLGITCSIGLGTSKTVAKIASDMDKPQGLTVVYPGREESFLSNLPAKALSGIGPAAQRQLDQLGLRTLGDIASADSALLLPIFGKNTEKVMRRCKGIDRSPVQENPPEKTVSNEISFAESLLERKDIVAAIKTVSGKIARRLRLKGHTASGVVLKIKGENLQTKSASARLPRPSNSESEMGETLVGLLDKVWAPGSSVRLVGAAATALDECFTEQMGMFENDSAPTERSVRYSDLQDATDAVRNRYGEHALSYGRELRTRENLTATVSKNPADYRSKSPNSS